MFSPIRYHINGFLIYYCTPVNTIQNMINHVFSHQVYLYATPIIYIYINTNLNKVSTSLKDTEKKKYIYNLPHNIIQSITTIVLLNTKKLTT